MGEAVILGRLTPMKKLLQLEFVPRNADLGLLVLRLGLGLPMLALHGWGKLMSLIGYFGGGEIKMPDVIGIGSLPTLILAVFAEVVCSALVVLGLWTRFAVLFLIALVGVAFFIAHKAVLSGPGNGELALIFLVGFLALLLTGAGKYSLDRK